MKRRIILCSLVFLLGLSINLPWGMTLEAPNEDDALIAQGADVGDEIDKLLEEIHGMAESVATEEEIAVPTKVVTPAQITRDLIAPEKRDQTMDLEFDNADLEDALRIIGDAGGVNIVLDPALKGRKVDLHLKDVRIDEALQLVYSAYGLGSYQIGTSLYVSDKAKIKQEAVITKMIKLRNVEAEEIKELIKDLVDVINISKETNNLVVVGNPEDIAKVEGIIANVDVSQPQVVLEAKVIEIATDALREVGIDWSDSITTFFQESTRPGTITVGSTVNAPDSLLHIYNFARNAIQFETILKMLENKNKAKTLSTPRVTTLNNKSAEIFVGDKVPYTITTVTGGAATTEVRFVEPGIRLKITPSIIEEDFVVIKIEPEVSYIYSWRGEADQYPWVKTREATAYVRVKNNQPFVLGGLLDKADKNNLYKVPFLGDVPLLGNLFKYEKTTYEDSELIITVTPSIISDSL